ncbi:hypothetical protein A9Q84_12855 [Halobacteriovorax marinus]|uniref:Enoyl-CoA hydratase n=1 Tax=Halobacteriovorax marinus TaxID=97084 RepID=A0A1Y5FE10_9BACT|nr:hypothetical protein A9Q84_12855 [Halobacteriovorax marinus]
MSLFNYNTLSVSLSKETRSIVVELNRPEIQNAINTEMIFELETLFTWVSTHIEIKTILFTGRGDYFCKGLDDEEFSTWSDEKKQKNFEKLQKLVYSMFYLPQTIIVDLKNGAKGLGLELAMGADIRIANHEAEMHFNHLQKGIVPSCGGIGFTSALFSNGAVRQWLLASKKLNATELLNNNIILESYKEESTASSYLQTISNQPDIPRIQAKRSLLEPIMEKLDKTLEWEKTFSLAGMCTNDWREIAKFGSEAQCTTAKELSSKLKVEREQQLSN